jgi:C4-dicarboxylate-specific signal transduction histidine kinase
MDGRVVAVRIGVLSAVALVFLGVLTWLGWVYPMVLADSVAAPMFTMNALSMAGVLLVLGRAGERMRAAARTAWRNSNDVLQQEVLDHEVTRTRLNRTHLDLVASAHIAGAAQMATGILHNLGNALNAVQVSTGLAEAQLGAMRLNRVEALTELIEPQVDAKVTRYSRLLVTELESTQSGLRQELRGIRESVEHAAAIVSTQQRHAVRTSVTERVKVSEVLADALSLCRRAESSIRVDVRCAELPMVVIDRHRVLQILTNLLTNAYDALNGSDDGVVSVEAVIGGGSELVFTVTDNGVGIDSADLDQVFAHGFTTRPEGHGFGLHASAIAAQELGGSLATNSAGRGLGACFTLSIPSPWADNESATG